MSKETEVIIVFTSDLQDKINQICPEITMQLTCMCGAMNELYRQLDKLQTVVQEVDNYDTVTRQNKIEYLRRDVDKIGDKLNMSFD